MNQLDKARFIERPQFFDGQTLFADDMQTIEAFNREMRWLHNRLLHRTGAIGNGFAVKGDKGDRVVVIGPGLALDHEGREIVLLEELSEPVPPIAGDEESGPAYYDLTVSYPTDDQLEATETRSGFCDKVGAVRLREKPIVTWVRLKKTAAGSMEVKDGEQRAAIKRGELVVIARASVLECQLNDVLSLKQRRSARPSCRPYIASGVEEMPQWRLRFGVDRDELIDSLTQALQEDDSNDDDTGSGNGEPGVFAVNPLDQPSGQLFFGVEAIIDTTSAGFNTTPYYSARLEGNRFKTFFSLQEDETDSSSGLIIVESDPIFIDADVYIDDSEKNRFSVRIVMNYRSDTVDDSLGVNLVEKILSQLIELHQENFSGIPEKITNALNEVQTCIEVSNGDEQAIHQCIDTFLNFIEEEGVLYFLPDDWKIVWMGVEG